MFKLKSNEGRERKFIQRFQLKFHTNIIGDRFENACFKDHDLFFMLFLETKHRTAGWRSGSVLGP